MENHMKKEVPFFENAPSHAIKFDAVKLEKAGLELVATATGFWLLPMHYLPVGLVENLPDFLTGCDIKPDPELVEKIYDVISKYTIWAAIKAATE